MPARASYLPQFTRLLKQVREDSGLTVRQLARVMGFSHPHVVRATAGKRLPKWPFVCSYLNCCGVGGEALYAWWELWRTTRSVEHELRRPARADQDRQWYWEMVERDWQENLAAIREPDAILTRLRSVTTLDELGVAVHALVTRAGLDSVRKVEALTNIPKTTLHHWFSSTRKPDPARLRILVKALEGTAAEQLEFVRALERIGDSTCGVRTEQTRQRCVLGEFHKGRHRAANGEEWLDDGVLDGGRGPQQWVTERAIQSAGPHW